MPAQGSNGIIPGDRPDTGQTIIGGRGYQGVIVVPGHAVHRRRVIIGHNVLALGQVPHFGGTILRGRGQTSPITAKGHIPNKIVVGP